MKKLEPIFIEVLSKSQENMVVNLIYKHANLPVTEFNECYPLLNKLSLENKDVILMGDFNVDLLHYENHNQSRDILDKKFSASLKPHITTPTRITPWSKTLIDNTFANFLDEDILCGNLTCSTNDHLAQFLIYTNKTLRYQKLKKEIHIKKYIYTHFRTLDKRKFKEELENIDWNQLLDVYCDDPNISLNIFLKLILDRYIPLISVIKRMKKTYSKSCMIRGILVSIKKKSKIYSKFCLAKDPERNSKNTEIL